MHVVKDEPQQEQQQELGPDGTRAKLPKLTRRQFREIVNKETMMNGKAFEDCTRMELFEMYLSLLKNVGILHRQVAELKAKYEPAPAAEPLPLTEEMAEEVVKEVESLLDEPAENSRYSGDIEDAEYTEVAKGWDK